MRSPRRQFSVLAGLCLLLAGVAMAPISRSGASVYWGGGHAVGAANLDGTMPIINYPYEIANMSPVDGEACGVAVNGSHIFWADQSGGAIGRMDLSQSPTGRLEFSESLNIDQSFVSGLVEPCGVAVDGAHIYWASRGGDRIGRANLDGSQLDPNFIIGTAGPCGVAVDQAHIYWASQATGSIGRANLDGSEADPDFIVGAEGPCGVAVDGAHIYWADQLGGTIGRASLDGGEVLQDLVSGLDSPCGVAVDGTHVYWAGWFSQDGLVGRASLDGSGVNKSLVSAPFYRASCGVALDSRLFRPPPPPPSRPIHFGKLKHNLRTGSVLLTVVVPASGELTVTSPGVGWALLKGKPTPPNVGGSFTWRLKVWPGKNGPAARRIRRQLRKEGKAPLTLDLSYTEDGHLPHPEVKQFALIRRR
jgi:hypothetical protein